MKPKTIVFEDVWPLVLATVRSVINKSRYGDIDIPTWQSRFSDIYDICSASDNLCAERLYDETKQFLEDHCTSLRKDISASEQNMLNIYVKSWNEFKIGSEHLNSLYSFLNNVVAKKGRQSDLNRNMFDECYAELSDDTTRIEIGELSLDSWRRIIIEPSKDHLLQLILDQIHLDRLGEYVNQNTIQTVIMSFVDVCRHRKITALEFYEKNFEAPFLQSTGEYYREEGNNCLTKLNCIQYMKKVLLLIDNEELRSCKFLNPTSYVKVKNECLQRLVCDHFDTFRNECNELILREDFDALRNMYKLLKPTQIGIKYLVEKFQEHMFSVGCEKIQSLKGDNLPTLFVETLLEFHTKYLNIMRDTFSNDSDFISALDKACEKVVNMRNENVLPMKSAELVAHYCDSLLRKSPRVLNDNEMEEKILHGIIIFNYLDDKDYFQHVYQKMLARRLINQQSISSDAEEFMLKKLKELCGFEFTSKLARMFQDIKISDDLNTSFFNRIKAESKLPVQNQTMANLIGLDFHAYVLQLNSWPITQATTSPFSLPHSLENTVRLFEVFYNKQHNGRKLSWMYSKSYGEIRMSHLNRPYFVTMGTYQMAVLLLFNEQKKYTLNEIQEATRLEMKELEKNISPLIDSQILLMDGNTSTGDSTVSINEKFKSKRTKFKISVHVQKEAVEDMEVTRKAVDDDRKFYLQAITVRIMKSRKTLKHNLLVQEIIAQSKQRFLPSIPLIKKCIEVLIDKQYLERNSTDEYTYIT